ncbi:MAG: NAD(P)/FAD-dependent oxidoreductase, partial [Candidatus Caldarchaeum sp.]
MSADAVCIGAGTAGLAFGIYAAQKGYKVEVYDRKKEIGLPIRSTGGIAEYAVRLYGLKIEDEWSYPIKRITLATADGDESQFDVSKPAGYVLDQTQFELYLAEKAESLGAGIYLGREVDPANLAGRESLVVGADGPFSMTRKLVGLQLNNDMDMHVGYEVWIPSRRLDVEEYEIKIVYSTVYAPYGYIWFFRYKDMVKVGCGVPMAFNRQTPVKNLLASYLLRVEGVNIEEYEHSMGGVIPTGPPLDRVVHRIGGTWFALLGDAGNMVNASTGGGLQFAIASAYMLAENLEEPSGYQKEYCKVL